MRSLLFIFILNLSLFAFHSHEKKTEKDSSMLETTLLKVENGLKYIYDSLNTSSKYIDEFLTNKYDDTTYTQSYIRIEQSSFIYDREDFESNTNFDIRIRLPKLKEKLSITFDNNDGKNNEIYQDSNEKNKQKDDNFNVGLLYNTIKNDYNLKFKVGVKNKKDSYIFTTASIQKIYKLDINNTITLEEKLKYAKANELENFTSADFVHTFNTNTYFSFFNEYYTNTKEKYDNLHSSIRYSKKLSDKKFINYVIASETNNQLSNFKIKEYEAYVSYRKYIKKWLYYDVIPSVKFEELDNFKEKPGIKFNLGILIAK